MHFSRVSVSVRGYMRLFKYIGRGALITQAQWSLTWKLMRMSKSLQKVLLYNNQSN